MRMLEACVPTISKPSTCRFTSCFGHRMRWQCSSLPHATSTGAHESCSDAERLEQHTLLVSNASAAAIRACSMSGLGTEPFCPASLSARGVLLSCRTKLVKESVEGWLVIAANKTAAQLYDIAGRATKAAISAMVSIILMHVICCMNSWLHGLWGRMHTCQLESLSNERLLGTGAAS